METQNRRTPLWRHTNFRVELQLLIQYQLDIEVGATDHKNKAGNAVKAAYRAKPWESDRGAIYLPVPPSVRVCAMNGVNGYEVDIPLQFDLPGRKLAAFHNYAGDWALRVLEGELDGVIYTQSFCDFRAERRYDFPDFRTG